MRRARNLSKRLKRTEQRSFRPGRSPQVSNRREHSLQRSNRFKNLLLRHRRKRAGPRVILQRSRVPRRSESLTKEGRGVLILSLIHISEPTRLGMISYAVFCLKKKKKKKTKTN